ncbi:gas vesicle protein GvpD [Halanaeroarchaeum sulfurireducens]|uniref:non-specific serine/threonine protein kinase n=1 Tax=Halanaeroarchaeum sulfurireducens TaxID=1604004 RepID=A0A0F7PD96_9EURY|nr:gas vesicle protein GvpD [Halanaeroarchaeum sulfurireducens]AKH98657.1 circadian clock protein, KaiC [Halanaeroarchaeum sulfurireducens]ALG83100.1 circadian clock protein, KaiC [Halanaeroarchaeum sulfurireducens]
METNQVSTGIKGLDRILDNGLLRRQNALLRGPPGAGKTIFGLHFLAEGVEQDETSLYINLGEPTEYVQRTAAEFDLHPDDIHFHDLSPSDDQFAEDEAYSLFEAADVEQSVFIEELKDTIQDIDPDRVLVDPITEFRYLTKDDRQFRKQILGLLDLLKDADATVLLTSQAAETVSDDDLQFLTDTVISLHKHESHRTVEVSKFRGSSFRDGHHSYEINDEGVAVWPRIRPDRQATTEVTGETLSSGVPELDQLLNGGITQGTVTFLSGPTGVGKTTTGAQFLKEGVTQGKKAVMYQFEEARHTLLQRAEAVNIPIKRLVEDGDLSIEEIPPEAYTLDEFGQIVRTAVEEDGVDMVMIDGTQGFKQNLRGLGDDAQQALLHLGRYLRSQGVSVIIAHEIHNVTGTFQVTEEGTSNLADTIIFLRHVEYQGEMRKVIGTLKMRASDFERSLREFEITEYGLSVGEPLPNLRGILSGTPEWSGDKDDS